MLRHLACACLGLALLTPFVGAEAPRSVPAGRWTTFANGDDVLDLAVDGTTLWAGTRAGGLVRWDTTDGTWTQYLRPQDPIGGNTVRRLALDGEGRLWLATDGGLSVLDDGGTPEHGDDAWWTYTVDNSLGGLPSDEVRALALDGDRVWVAGGQHLDPASGAWSGGGVGRLDTLGTADVADDTWTTVATYESTRREAPDGTVSLGLVSDHVNDLVLSPEGNLWVATSPHRRFESTGGTNDPLLWLKVDGGLSFLDTAGTPDAGDDRWTAASCEDPTFELMVTCHVADLALDSGGRVWAAVGGRGVIWFIAERGNVGNDLNRQFAPSAGQGGRFVEGIAFGPEDDPALANTVWLATRDGGLSVLDHRGTPLSLGDDAWDLGRGGPFTVDDGLPRDRTQALAVGDGGMWVGSGARYAVGGGISSLDLEDLSVGPPLRTADTGLPANFITDFDFGTPGSRWADHVWIATGSRAQRLFGAGVIDLDTAGTLATSDDTWTRYTTEGTDDDGTAPWTGLAGNNVHAVAVQDDLVWLGSTESRWDVAERRYADGGLSVFDGVDWTVRTVDLAAGPRDGSVSSLLVGCSGELWVGTGNPWDYVGTGVDVLTTGASVHDPAGDSWAGHSYADLASNNTTGLAADCAGGRMWVSAAHHVTVDPTGGQNGQLRGGGVAVREPDGQWTRFDAGNGLESYAEDALTAEAMAVASAPDGRTWVGTYGLVGMRTATLIAQRPYWPAVVNTWDGSAWSPTVFEGHGWVSSMDLDGDGRLWVAMSRGGAARDSIHPESWRTDRVTDGLRVLDGDTWQVLDVASTGLPANEFSVVAVAPSGDVWVGTEGWGLARFTTGEDLRPTATATLDRPPTSTATATPTGEATPTGGPSPTATDGPSPSPTDRRPTPTSRPTDGPRINYLPYALQWRAGRGL